MTKYANARTGTTSLLPAGDENTAEYSVLDGSSSHGLKSSLSAATDLEGANPWVPCGNDYMDGEMDDAASELEKDTVPVRRLNSIDGFAILVGIIIGSGIFSSPGVALERVGSPGMVLFSWTASGFLVFLACQCYLELGSMMPSAGGDFDYLRAAYGERAAFAFAWYNFFIGKTGSQAIIATIFGEYFDAVIRNNLGAVSGDDAEGGSSGDSSDGDSGSGFPTSKIISIALIVIITTLNCAGIKESVLLQRVLTSTKFVLIAITFLMALIFISSGGGSNARIATSNLTYPQSFHGSKGIVGFGSSMVACLWGFDGWADLNFMQEELICPHKQLPVIVKSGVAAVTVCYLLMNVAYLCALTPSQITDSDAIAVEFGDAVSTTGFALFMALGVSLSTAGSVNGSIMTGGRAIFAVARGGKGPRLMGTLNAAGAPYAALLAQGCWSIVLLVLPGSNFSSLLDYFGPISWLFYAFTSSSLITLRYKKPDTHRPYRVPLYPLPPLLVISLALVIFTSSMLSSPLFTSLAVGFVALSFPVHLAMERWGGWDNIGPTQGHGHGSRSVSKSSDRSRSISKTRSRRSSSAESLTKRGGGRSGEGRGQANGALGSEESGGNGGVRGSIDIVAVSAPTDGNRLDSGAGRGGPGGQRSVSGESGNSRCLNPLVSNAPDA